MFLESLQCPGQLGGLRRVRTIQAWWRNSLRDTPMGIRMQRTADWPFEQSSLSVNGHKHWSHRNFHMISYRSVWESRWVHTLGDGLWMGYSHLSHVRNNILSRLWCCCSMWSVCFLANVLPWWIVAKSRCLFKYDLTGIAWELQDSWLQSQKLHHGRRSGSSSAKMYGSTECLGFWWFRGPSLCDPEVLAGTVETC